MFIHFWENRIKLQIKSPLRAYFYTCICHRALNICKNRPLSGNITRNWPSLSNTSSTPNIRSKKSRKSNESKPSCRSYRPNVWKFSCWVLSKKKKKKNTPGSPTNFRFRSIPSKPISPKLIDWSAFRLIPPDLQGTRYKKPSKDNFRRLLRSVADLNCCTRFCRPLPNRSANRPCCDFAMQR